MSNITNFFGSSTGALGPCNTTIDPTIWSGDAGTAIALGNTQGTTLRAATEKADLTSDQDGTQPFNKVLTGINVELELSLVKTTHEILAQVLQGYTSYNSGASGSSVTIAIGEDDLSIATPLELIRIVDGVDSTDPDDQLIITMAAPMSEPEWVFDAATQRVTACKFKCYKSTNYVDASTGAGLYMFTRRAWNDGYVTYST